MGYSLILGGTKGFGLALAHESAECGITPIITGPSVDDTETIASLPKNAVRIQMDLANDESVTKAMSSVEPYQTEYFFWNAGIWPGRIPFRDLPTATIDAIITVNFTGALKALQQFHKKHVVEGRPYNLVAISSKAAWQISKNETVYCASKDAQAVFVLNFADELAEDLPGSHTTIVYPGGMKTAIFGTTGQDTTGYMDPRTVAKAVWDEIQNQKETCREVHILRNKEKNDGSFTVTYGPKERGLR